MNDKDELLFFLRDCIKAWEHKLKIYIPSDTRKTWFTTMLNKAKALVKEHKLLYQYDFTIKTPLRITGGMIKSMTENLAHYLTGYGAEINSREFLVDDDRKLPIVPGMCKGCKWLRNSECWYNEEYYGSDFPIDCDRYEKEA